MRATALAIVVAAGLAGAALVSAQTEITDAQLAAASGGHVVRLGPAAGSQSPVVTLPLELYVARVLAGEVGPKAADAAQQALAVAVRTYAQANLGRHVRDGFDLCDGTHCQVPRPPTPVSRRAALATAGQLLTYGGAPAALFYSASCGGYSESAAQVWPGADYPYLQAAPDEVHEGEEPWMLELPLEQVERALRRAGFEGRLRDVRIGERNASGRAARLELEGLVPDVIAGDPFRAAVGTTTLRSTAFAVERRGDTLHFTGRGYGHGVGMCVIGAGRRAERGQTAAAILGQYYPGLALTRLPPVSAPAPPPVVTTAAAPLLLAPPGAAAARARGPIIVQVMPPSAIGDAEVERLTGQAHDGLGRLLGVSVAPITVRMHGSLESFRQATGRPWWVSVVAEGTSMDLVPAALLAQRDGVDTALRMGVAELLVGSALAGRPRWVRVGAARYFGRDGSRAAADPGADVKCPSDAELMLAISATAQREAEARAEACFARAYARTRDWRAVR